jgi:HPt (histidine-containing phosphotransfer) domain-containing protein
VAPSNTSPPDTVIQSLGSTWSQHDLGEAFDVATMSVLSELDPSGVNGIISEVLILFQASLDPVLERLEHCRSTGAAADIRFEAHRLKSAAAQLGALRLASACAEIMKNLSAEGVAPTGSRDAEVELLVDQLVAEIVRVQRQLRRLLQP